MEFYEVLEKRRTYRDYSDREVSDEILKRVIGAAFKAPTNDHLRQWEFVVVRDPEKIRQLVAPVSKNTETYQVAGVAAAADMLDKDEYAMFVSELPKQQRMLMQSNCLILPFFRQPDRTLTKPKEQQSLNYFASIWCALENIFLAATAEDLACAFRIPIAGEAEHVKKLVNAPEDYEMPCFLTIGYPKPDAVLPKQKEIDIEERIHTNLW